MMVTMGMETAMASGRFLQQEMHKEKTLPHSFDTSDSDPSRPGVSNSRP